MKISEKKIDTYNNEGVVHLKKIISKKWLKELNKGIKKKLPKSKYL